MPRRRGLLDRIIEYLGDLMLWKKLAFVASIIIAGGLFYVLAEKPVPMTSAGMVHPSSRSQTSSELFLAAFGYSLGALGFYLVFTAKRHTYNPRYVNFQVLAGTLLIVLSIFFLSVMVGLKGF